MSLLLPSNNKHDSTFCFKHPSHTHTVDFTSFRCLFSGPSLMRAFVSTLCDSSSPLLPYTLSAMQCTVNTYFLSPPTRVEISGTEPVLMMVQPQTSRTHGQHSTFVEYLGQDFHLMSSPPFSLVVLGIKPRACVCQARTLLLNHIPNPPLPFK